MYLVYEKTLWPLIILFSPHVGSSVRERDAGVGRLAGLSLVAGAGRRPGRRLGRLAAAAGQKAIDFTND